jgi:uracil phosphoribosyltransferase
VRILDEEKNPIVGELLKRVRSVAEQSGRGLFRDTLRRFGALLAYEISKTLESKPHECATPLGRRVEPVLAEDPVLVTIMRASLPMWDGMLEVFERADTIFIGAARREGAVAPLGDPSLPVDLGYAAWTRVEGRTLIYVDPMIATGSTLRVVHERLIAKCGRPRRVIVAGVIAYRETLKKMEQPPLSAEIFVASADDQLNTKGYIVPGLGDAGDLAFGSKL